ncbi:MAG: cation-transporting P-type ATPase [Gammaproteobacteria bacterium]
MPDDDAYSAARSAPHARRANELRALLGAGEGGLATAEAVRRLAELGPNRLPAARQRGPLRRLLAQFHNIFIYVLLGAAAITASLGHVLDTLVILAVVVANALIGFVQEGRAEKAMDAIRRMLAPVASVIRDGRRREIDADTLVPGDLVVLEPGDKVPADLRLTLARGLQIQEAILTGESVPVDKTLAPVGADVPLGDRHCMAYSGTLVTSGQGQGVVVATGSASEIGRISGLLSEVDTLTTPLVTQMDAFARWLTVFILLVAGLLLVYGYYVGHHDFAEMFMAVVGLSVSAIPESLPAVLTIALAVGVQAMARRHAIVRRLPAIETIGAVSVICTDKTGTLTRNEMMVASIATRHHLFDAEGDGYAPEGVVRLDSNPVAPADFAVLGELGHACALCNDAALHRAESDWSVAGDPMEGALLAFAGRLGLDLPLVQASWVRADAIPFDARHRYMATLNRDHRGHAAIFVKGAPERLLAMCATERVAPDLEQPLDLAFWTAQADAIAGRGQRVLAFATRAAEPERTVLDVADLEGRLSLLGLVGLIDPPRPEAVAAVADCRRAGIQVKMITGDHAQTAAAIGAEIGLAHADRVLTGGELDALDDTALKSAVLDCDVFARTSPEHKLRLVQALQSHGFIVAMTGDGVNDAPALKRADVGIAMGRKGSEAAKEAAQLVLADDNFASIAAAVREGRTVHDNIRKVISWTLPTNGGEAMTIIVALLVGVTLPVTPIQILWINLVTAATLGIALAFEPTEANTMRRPPRVRGEPVLDGALLWHVLLVSVLFLGFVYGVFSHALDRGHSLELARTLAVNMIVILEIFHLFFIRNLHGSSLSWAAARGTPAVWITVILVTLAQFAFTYLPAAHQVFGSRPVPFLDGVLLVALGTVFFALVETEKQMRLRLRADSPA